MNLPYERCDRTVLNTRDFVKEVDHHWHPSNGEAAQQNGHHECRFQFVTYYIAAGLRTVLPRHPLL